MAESYVTLPTDGSGKSIRLLVVTPAGATTTSDQEVVAIADEDGRVAHVGGRELWSSDSLTQSLLLGIAKRLDIIGANIDRKYQPPDDLTEDLRWT
jgi:hypothetical protein